MSVFQSMRQCVKVMCNHHSKNGNNNTEVNNYVENRKCKANYLAFKLAVSSMCDHKTFMNWLVVWMI